MDKAILVIDMPSCCDACFALDDNGDYPYCLITHEQRGYTFRTREQKMDKCPLKPYSETSVAYVCDQKECELCNNPDCHYTLDIKHAKNFEEVEPGKYIEKEY